MPFVENKGELFILYERRAKHMKTQPGEICFPGGKMEACETAMESAIRETSEELSIDPDKIKVIGQGDTLYTYGNLALYTFIGSIEYETYKNIEPEPEEVDEVFLVPVKKLLESQPKCFQGQVSLKMDEGFPYNEIGVDKNYPWKKGIWHVPYYDIDGRAIWGMTAKITENVISRVWKREKIKKALNIFHNGL